jgi:hypothetical protein
MYGARRKRHLRHDPIDESISIADKLVSDTSLIDKIARILPTEICLPNGGDIR